MAGCSDGDEGWLGEGKNVPKYPLAAMKGMEEGTVPRGRKSEEERTSPPSVHSCLSSPKAGACAVLHAQAKRELFARDTAGSWQPDDISWEHVRVV